MVNLPLILCSFLHNDARCQEVMQVPGKLVHHCLICVDSEKISQVYFASLYFYQAIMSCFSADITLGFLHCSSF